MKYNDFLKILQSVLGSSYSEIISGYGKKAIKFYTRNHDSILFIFDENDELWMIT